MGFLKNLFGQKPTPEEPDSNEQAVIVEFKYGFPNLDRLFEVDDLLEAAAEKSGAGEHDGHEIAVDLSDGSYYLYGPDADKLYEAIRPVLESQDFTKRAKVTLRYGPPEDGVPEKVVIVGG